MMQPDMPIPPHPPKDGQFTAMTSTDLNRHHRKTLDAIFEHPTNHNLEWHDALSLLGHVGTVENRHGGGYNITIGTQHLKLGVPHDHDLTADDMRDLRAFLAKAGFTALGQADGDLGPADGGARLSASTAGASGSGCIVVIDHHEARLFKLDGADPATPHVLKPQDADGPIRRVEHKQGQDDHDGGHGQEEDAYYEHVAVNLSLAKRIVVLSDGKGRSNAGAYLIDYLKRHHPALSARIVAVQRVDIAHLSDAEFAALGRTLLTA